VRTFASMLSLALLLVGASALAAAPCTPASCTATFHGITFESLAPGSPVEGLGTVDPLLGIASVPWAFGAGCPLGSSRVIEEGNVLPFISYATASGPNGCLDGIHGMGHPANCVLDYDFTFASGVTVGCFAVKMVDFGDYYPYGGTVHNATLTAYDASHAVVSVATLTGGASVDSTSGDACLSQAGLPGNYVLSVGGAGITRVELRFDSNPDPNVGFDSIAFCVLTPPTANRPRSWGTLKARYR